MLFFLLHFFSLNPVSYFSYSQESSAQEYRAVHGCMHKTPAFMYCYWYAGTLCILCHSAVTPPPHPPTHIYEKSILLSFMMYSRQGLLAFIMILFRIDVWWKRVWFPAQTEGCFEASSYTECCNWCFKGNELFAPE